MARYWPSSFLRAYGPRRSRGPLTRKKRTRPISSHVDRTSLVNKGLYDFRGKFSSGIRRVVPSGRGNIYYLLTESEVIRSQYIKASA